MDIAEAVTYTGLPEAWAAISFAMVLTYFMLSRTAWHGKLETRSAFKKASVVLALSLLISYMAVWGIKNTTQIPRECLPCEAQGVPDGCNPHCIKDDFAFPSGHSAAIFAAAVTGVLLSGRRKSILLLAYASVVAYSRVALGVHTYPDIAAGSLIGAASALFAWRVRPRLGLLA